MKRNEFSGIRRCLGKTQLEMARLLGTSLKSVQSFEQGWRKIPPHTERHVLFLLQMTKLPATGGQPCWDIVHCSSEMRQQCPAWEYQAGHLCWFINGTMCQGRTQENWIKKMSTCRKCQVFQSMMPMEKVAVGESP